jgi:hypothetical protein
MSQWTHVVGAIRFDALITERHEVELTEIRIRNVLNANVPTGSEGPIEFGFLRSGYFEAKPGHPTCSSLDFGIAYFWGDLRDYEDVDEIQAWVTGAVATLQGHGICVRQMVVQVDVEYQATHFLYDAVNKNFEKIINKLTLARDTET